MYWLLLASLSILLYTCPLTTSVKCYSSQMTIPGPSSQMVIVDCPAAQYCFKSYIERDTRGDRSVTETRACGNVGTCFEVGCRGPGDNHTCCCAGDLCNSSVRNSSLLSLLCSLLFSSFILKWT